MSEGVHPTADANGNLFTKAYHPQLWRLANKPLMGGYRCVWSGQRGDWKAIRESYAFEGWYGNPVRVCHLCPAAKEGDEQLLFTAFDGAHRDEPVPYPRAAAANSSSCCIFAFELCDWAFEAGEHGVLPGKSAAAPAQRLLQRCRVVHLARGAVFLVVQAPCPKLGAQAGFRLAVRQQALTDSGLWPDVLHCLDCGLAADAAASVWQPVFWCLGDVYRCSFLALLVSLCCC